MLELCLTLLLISGAKCIWDIVPHDSAQAKVMSEVDKINIKTIRKELKEVDQIQHVAHFGDAEHRGPAWYDFSSTDGVSKSDVESSITDSASSFSSEKTTSSSSSTDEASSIESNDKDLIKRVWRACTPCPHEMLKKHTNIGIKWICGKYQRARRTFKSECMMRYRNCEDGTMFTKIADHRCVDDKYHGRTWFYDYRV